MMDIFQKVDDGERTVPRIRALGAQPSEGGEARPKVELGRRRLQRSRKSETGIRQCG